MVWYLVKHRDNFTLLDLLYVTLWVKVAGEQRWPLPSSTEFKNAWSFTSKPLIRLNDVVLRHSGNLTGRMCGRPAFACKAFGRPTLVFTWLTGRIYPQYIINILEVSCCRSTVSGWAQHTDETLRFSLLWWLTVKRAWRHSLAYTAFHQ
jgi:hypothetical protein